MSRREAARQCPRPPSDAPVFDEPWQAEAFAMTVALHERGLFSWAEWAAALSAEVKKTGCRRRRQRLLRLLAAGAGKAAGRQGRRRAARCRPAGRRLAACGARHAARHGRSCWRTIRNIARRRETGYSRKASTTVATSIAAKTRLAMRDISGIVEHAPERRAGQQPADVDDDDHAGKHRRLRKRVGRSASASVVPAKTAAIAT